MAHTRLENLINWLGYAQSPSDGHTLSRWSKRKGRCNSHISGGINLVPRAVVQLVRWTELEQVIGYQADVCIHGICCIRRRTCNIRCHFRRIRRRINWIRDYICHYIRCCIHCRLRRIVLHNRQVRGSLIQLFF